MEWTVVKLGADMLDMLHAFGLAILLAYATGAPVQLRDIGLVYQLICSGVVRSDGPAALLRNALAVPTTDDIEALDQEQDACSAAVANLDGLLAALFTTPGKRLVSVHDMLSKKRLDPAVMQAGLAKVSEAVERLVAYAVRMAHASSTWTAELLSDYIADHPSFPVPVTNQGRDISIPMTVDPIFSYSTRRPLSDGLITDKTSVALSGTRYATLLVFIGAARFLRAQRVAGDLVNLYIPLAHSMTLDAETALPLLAGTDCTPDHAFTLQWLRYAQYGSQYSARWNGLAYQTLQTQGRQQSISRDRGCLDYTWLAYVEQRAGAAVTGYWTALLSNRREHIPFEIDHLLDSLTLHRVDAWMAHLRDVAMYVHYHPDAQKRLYSVQEVKEITIAMSSSTNSPLSTILGREKGTRRFGHALRQLGEVNRAALPDIIDALNAVRSRDTLMRVLAQAMQECKIASAKSPFIIIPDDEDLTYLLDDIDQYSAPTIAGLLCFLSPLRYPPKVEASAETASSSGTAADQTSDDVHNRADPSG